MATACVCSERLQVTDTGELCVVPGSSGLRQMVTYTQGGVFDPDAFPWLARVRVRVHGGGGSGGGVEATGDGEEAEGGGGAGGGYAESVIERGALGGAVTVTVGQGGAGAAPGQDGNVGGNSSFGGFVAAPGGGGGQVGVATDFHWTALAGAAPHQFTGQIWGRGSDGGTGRVIHGVAVFANHGGAGGGVGGTTNRAVGTPTGAPTGGGSPGAFNSPEEAAKGTSMGWPGLVVVELYA